MKKGAGLTAQGYMFHALCLEPFALNHYHKHKLFLIYKSLSGFFNPLT
jgi:hypothetical protein